MLITNIVKQEVILFLLLELECVEEARFCARVSDSRDLILPDCMSRKEDTICIKEGEHNNCGSLLKTVS